MTKKISKLSQLTGLSSEELANVLQKNPRAYMAVKGAVAEKHLSKILNAYLRTGAIKKVAEANSDFDKDFYIKNNNGNTLSIECKNVEVIKLNKKIDIVQYVHFLIGKSLIAEDNLIHLTNTHCNSNIATAEELSNLKSKELIILFKHLPQELRESGITRYQFSASNITKTSCLNISPYSFIEQFDYNLLSIDFQRTRNSTDTDGDKSRKRLYRVGEIDIVAACLFSRTMNWEFIYAKASSFEKHNKYKDRYKNTLRINKKHWTNNLSDLINI